MTGQTVSAVHTALANFGSVDEATREAAYQLVVAVNTTYTVISRLYAHIPGSQILYRYIKASYQDDPFRMLLEAGLVIFMVWYFVAKRYQPGQQTEVKLTEKEIQELIDEWEPEPLVPELTKFQAEELAKTHVLSSAAGLKVKSADGKERLNCASFNFLGVMNSEAVKLEEEISRFVNSEAAIIYSQGFACISSCIPAFSKRGDIIIADDAVSFGIQKGLQISRSQIKWFKHNDMADLERVLFKVQEDCAKKPLTRRFIVVEGLYVNLGDICPLPELVALKNKYKYRLIVEESMSFGVLGSRGAGVADHFGIPRGEIDIMVASMSNALASSGGFCAGSKEIVEHQRLSGLSYTFSASLPAVLAVGALESLRILETRPETLLTLAENASAIKSKLRKIGSGVVLNISSSPESPVIHLQLRSGSSREEDDRILQEIVDQSLKDGVLTTRSKYVFNQEHNPPPPSIRIVASAGFTIRESERCGTVICDAARRVLKQYRLDSR
ncbi:hypothetical protein BSLG_006926 [Batrachochytrium salamandrivorans]|nr:hypothetical protein BSLG_006926 [Batrachochytrium salamandrivorans]